MEKNCLVCKKDMKQDYYRMEYAIMPIWLFEDDEYRKVICFGCCNRYNFCKKDESKNGKGYFDRSNKEEYDYRVKVMYKECGMTKERGAEIQRDVDKCLDEQGYYRVGKKIYPKDNIEKSNLIK